MNFQKKSNLQSRQIIGRKIYLKQYFPFEKQTGPAQIRTHDLYHTRHNCSIQAKCAGDVKKFEFIMNQGTTRSSSGNSENLLVLFRNLKAFFTPFALMYMRAKNSFLHELK